MSEATTAAPTVPEPAPLTEDQLIQRMNHRVGQIIQIDAHAAQLRASLEEHTKAAAACREELATMKDAFKNETPFVPPPAPVQSETVQDAPAARAAQRVQPSTEQRPPQINGVRANKPAL